MKQLSVEELASSLGEAIQQVHAGETVEVMSNGKVVALLVRPNLSIEDSKNMPVPDIEERRAALARLDALAAEIGKHVQGPTDVAAMLSEMRR